MMATILLIDKDMNLRTTLHEAIFGDSHFLVHASNMDETVHQINTMQPDLVIVGALGTSADRVDICTRLRGMDSLAMTPILFLLNTMTAQEVARTLDAGGDDCIGKPIVARELAARVRALLRRRSRAMRQSQLVLDRANERVALNNRTLNLTPTEFALLDTLCQHPGEHLSTADLLERVWHYPPGMGDPALVRNHVRNLRRKLEVDPDHPRIVTSMHGRGYIINVEIWRP